uniref:Uncharacterized protein n=1 Tax=Noccaea caerulescens TaxID=107243 RepID=A0A1J3D844_NOCCA
MVISKRRQGKETHNLVRVYVANFRLKGVDTDVLVTAYEPILINPLRESVEAVGSSLAVPVSQSGVMPMCEVIKQSLSTFKVNDWSLFCSVP